MIAMTIVEGPDFKLRDTNFIRIWGLLSPFLGCLLGSLRHHFTFASGYVCADRHLLHDGPPHPIGKSIRTRVANAASVEQTPLDRQGCPPVEAAMRFLGRGMTTHLFKLIHDPLGPAVAMACYKMYDIKRTGDGRCVQQRVQHTAGGDSKKSTSRVRCRRSYGLLEWPSPLRLLDRKWSHYRD
jgi:hypothetical protein